MCVCVYIYIYIYIYICVCVCVCVYIYIYIYIPPSLRLNLSFPVQFTYMFCMILTRNCHYLCTAVPDSLFLWRYTVLFARCELNVCVECGLILVF